MAAGLLQLGLVPGDRVGLWGPNSSDWYISRLALARAGLVAVSTNILHLSTLTRKWAQTEGRASLNRKKHHFVVNFLKL
jgi:acyl-CoA synthetase (AMP-forming)/AMP-acid ligase II